MANPWDWIRCITSLVISRCRTQGRNYRVSVCLRLWERVNGQIHYLLWCNWDHFLGFWIEYTKTSAHWQLYEIPTTFCCSNHLVPGMNLSSFFLTIGFLIPSVRPCFRHWSIRNGRDRQSHSSWSYCYGLYSHDYNLERGHDARRKRERFSTFWVECWLIGRLLLSKLQSAMFSAHFYRQRWLGCISPHPRLSKILFLAQTVLGGCTPMYSNNLAVLSLLRSSSVNSFNSCFPNKPPGLWSSYAWAKSAVSVFFSSFGQHFAHVSTIKPSKISQLNPSYSFVFSTSDYTFFTFFSLLVARPPIHPQSRIMQKVFSRFSKLDTIAICFCAPAKSVSIGAPLIGVMWGVGFSNSVQSLVMVPIVLYQAQQILCGQIAVVLFRRWARDEWMPEQDHSDEEAFADAASGKDESIKLEAIPTLEIGEEGKDWHCVLYRKLGLIPEMKFNKILIHLIMRALHLKVLKADHIVIAWFASSNYCQTFLSKLTHSLRSRSYN